jgi:ESX secretion system protein EccE
VGTDGLLAILVEATGLDGPPQEYWSVWRSGRLVRTHYKVTGWTPAHGTLAIGVSQVAISYTGRGEPTVLAAASAQSAALVQLSREVVRACAAAGVRLQRLDGEQAPAAYASAPTAISLANLGPRSRDRRERGDAPGERAGAGRITTASVV